MKILALEFSSNQRSVAVFDSIAHGPSAVFEVVETGGRSTKAFGMIEEALRQAQIEREQIERIALGLGPGSYTGVRAAIAIAQGWQLARGVQLAGLSSADVIAGQAQAEGLLGKVAVIIDAQRKEFYAANYELTASGWHQVQALRLVSLAETQTLAESGWLLIGPEVSRWFDHSRLVPPQASMLAQIASARFAALPGEKIEPIYLREPQFVKAPPPRTRSSNTPESHGCQ